MVEEAVSQVSVMAVSVILPSFVGCSCLQGLFSFVCESKGTAPE